KGGAIASGFAKGTLASDLTMMQGSASGFGWSSFSWRIAVMDRFTAGCLCGNIRIVAAGQPYRVGICHCMDCRKHHGALFHASAIFPENAVTIHGEPRSYEGRFFLSALQLVRLQPLG